MQKKVHLPNNWLFSWYMTTTLFIQISIYLFFFYLGLFPYIRKLDFISFHWIESLIITIIFLKTKLMIDCTEQLTHRSIHVTVSSVIAMDMENSDCSRYDVVRTCSMFPPYSFIKSTCPHSVCFVFFEILNSNRNNLLGSCNARGPGFRPGRAGSKNGISFDQSKYHVQLQWFSCWPNFA